MLIKNQGKQKIILKSKKICESVYLKGNVASLLKTRFFVDSKPQGRKKKRNDLKLFENWSRIKII